LRLAKILHYLCEQVELELRILEHDLLQARPGNSPETGRGHGFGRIEVTPAFGKSEHVAGRSESENLPLAAFGTSADANEPVIDQIHEIGFLAFMVQRDATPEFHQGGG